MAWHPTSTSHLKSYLILPNKTDLKSLLRYYIITSRRLGRGATVRNGFR